MLGDGLWIILLEMVLVLALLVFIVWWTWPRAARDEEAQQRKAGSDAGK